MRRTRESQKAHLLNELHSSGSNKKVIATRGSQALIKNYKEKKSKNLSVPVFPLLGAWAVASFFLWFTFFKSFYVLAGVNVIGFIFIYLIKKVLVKEGDYQVISSFEKKKSLAENISEIEHLFNKDITDIVNEISQNIEYLEKFYNQDLLGMEQEHYIQSCKDKHLVDLFHTLKSSHTEHLEENQKSILEQLIGLNNKLKTLVLNVQQVIELKIKVKSAFTKDNY
jgi:hypothetical protein